MNKNFKLLKVTLEKAKENYKKYDDNHRLLPPKFKIGEKVWLIKENTPKGLSSKLAHKRMGPYKIR